MDPEIKLVTYTALAIVGEQGIGPLQEIRQKYDPAFNRWPPHINFCFPFVEPHKFPQIYHSLKDLFADFEEFEITFTEFSSFPHGTIFLVPTDPEHKINKIYEMIKEKHPELMNKDHKEFNPHMTAAKVKKFEIEKMKAEFQGKWQEWKFICRGLHMMAREKDTPFKTLNLVEFKKKEL